jgi:broad specificity phosphatase PhoE
VRCHDATVNAIPGVLPLDEGELVLVRHGATTYNESHLLNGDPDVQVHLSASGRAACAALAPVIGQVAWRSVWVTRFSRTVESLALMAPALVGTVIADLDDIALGELESRPRDDYRTWRETNGVLVAPAEGGESRVDALERYARGLARLAASAPQPALIVTHDQPIRYLLNTLLDQDPIFGPLDGIPNAVPYPLRAATVADAAARMSRTAAQLRGSLAA